MKLFLTFLIGAVGGFALGAWTPAGTMLDFEQVSQLATKVTGQEITVGETITLASEDAQARVKTAASPEELKVGHMALATDPATEVQDGDYVMALADLVHNPMTAAALQSSDEGGGSLSQDSPRQVTGTDGGEAELSDEDKQFIAMMVAAKAELEQENGQIDQMLEVGDLNHPQHFFLKCVRQSNLSQSTMFDFLIAVPTEGITMEKLSELQIAFDADQVEVNKEANVGEIKQQGMLNFFKILPAKSEADRELKKIAITIFETYTEAFEVERGLAANFSDYPSMVAMAMSGDPTGLENWETTLGSLIDRRMAIQFERDRLVAEYSAKAMSS